MGSDIDGENATVVFDGSESMAGVAVDILVTDDHIYWSDHPGSASAAIWRAGRDGSNPQKITEFGDFRAPHFFAIDEANGHIYFTDFGRGIFRIDLDGSNEEWVFDGQQAFPAAANHTGIYLRGPGDPVFLSTAFTLYEPDGDEFVTWVTPIANLPGSGATYGVALDEATQTIYYTTFNGGELRSYNLDTEEAAVLRTGMTLPLGVKLSPSKTHLLIAERGVGVSAYEFSTGYHALLVESSGAHFGVAVTADPGDLPEPPPPPPPPEDGDVLLEETFTQAELGEITPENAADYEGPWSRVTWHSNGGGTIAIVEDEENLFGRGVDNRVLFMENAHGFAFRSEDQFAEEVLTLELEMFHEGQFDPALTDRLTNRFFVNAATHPDTTINFGFQQRNVEEGTYRVRGITTDIDSGFLQRWVLVVNNSAETIEYDSPEGPQTLDSMMAAVWLNGERFADDYNFGQGNTGDPPYVGVGPMRFFVMETFSNNSWNGYIDNIRIYKGALIPDTDTEPGEGYAEWAGAHFGGEIDPDIVGPDADPSGDGVKNLVKYALGLDPTIASREGLPALGFDNVGGEDFLVLVFSAPDDRADVVYSVHVGGELGSLEEPADYVGGEPDPEREGHTIHLYRDVVPVTAGNRRFIQLSIELE